MRAAPQVGASTNLRRLPAMKSKFLRLFWVLLLVIAAFTLGYTLKPSSDRPRPFGSGGMSGGGAAPPLNFPGGR